jgi:hypothetical protein
LNLYQRIQCQQILLLPKRPEQWYWRDASLHLRDRRGTGKHLVRG